MAVVVVVVVVVGCFPYASLQLVYYFNMCIQLRTFHTLNPPIVTRACPNDDSRQNSTPYLDSTVKSFTSFSPTDSLLLFPITQVGNFGYESYLLFGLDDQTFTPSDKNLRAFANWRAQQVKKEEVKKEEVKKEVEVGEK